MCRWSDLLTTALAMVQTVRDVIPGRLVSLRTCLYVHLTKRRSARSKHLSLFASQRDVTY